MDQSVKKQKSKRDNSNPKEESDRTTYLRTEIENVLQTKKTKLKKKVNIRSTRTWLGGMVS